MEENVGGTIREYVSAFGVNAEMISSQEFTTTFDLPGGVQALYSPGGLQRFRFPDWQGSIRAESSSTRQFTESLAFAPFGERYAVAGAPYNVDSFTGKPDHLVSDEYDFPARQEHNGQGRWVSPDPMRGTGNKYVYADNNPLSKVDVYGLETVTIVMNGLDIGTTTLGEPEDMQLAITESHPPQSMQTSGNGSADNSQGGSDSSGLHFWQRIKNCFSGFCGMSDEEKAVWQKAVDTKIQNERKDVEKACPFGCLGKTASDIKKMSPQEVDRFYEAVQVAAQFAALIYGGVRIAPGQEDHIFRQAEGHLPDTPANRQLLTDVANDPANALGPDQHGNIWSAKALPDGTQAWVQVRGGQIVNGGINQTPRVYSPQTGLSSPMQP